MRTGDREGIVAQLSDARRRSLAALGREHDELERRVDGFLERWRADERTRSRRFSLLDAIEEATPPTDAPLPRGHRGGEVPLALAWFPSGDYERAIERWPDLADEWAGVPHANYCARLDGHAKWMHAHGVAARAIAPIHVDDYTVWCEQHDEDPTMPAPSTPPIAWPTAKRSPAARAQRAVLVRLAAQVQEVLRTRTGGPDARDRDVVSSGGDREPRSTHEMGNGMPEIDGAAMLRALAEEDALIVFAAVGEATGTGAPERAGDTSASLDDRRRSVAANGPA